MDDLGKKIQRFGLKLTWGLTVPMILFLLGLFTLPIGIIFWVLGIIIFIVVFFGNKPKK